MNEKTGMTEIEVRIDMISGAVKELQKDLFKISTGIDPKTLPGETTKEDIDKLTGLAIGQLEKVSDTIEQLENKITKQVKSL